MKNEEIKINKSWLETLVKYSERAEKAHEDWFKKNNYVLPEHITLLIGYTSSAKTLLKYCKK